MSRARLVPVLLVAGLAACSSSPSSAPGTTAASPAAASYAGQLASTDLYVDAPQHVQFGIVSQDPDQGVLLLTSGTIEAELSPPDGAGGTPVRASAGYVAAPGTEVADGLPRLTSPDVGRGVYEVDATFDVAGEWTAILSGETDAGTVAVTMTVPVAEEPALPAPGQPAIRSRNLTTDSPNPEAVDSRAMDGAPIRTRSSTRPRSATRSPTAERSSRCSRPPCTARAGSAARPPTRSSRSRPTVPRTPRTCTWRSGTTSPRARSTRRRPSGSCGTGLCPSRGSTSSTARGSIVDRWSPLFDPDDVRAALASV